jgi:Protein of unknown function (Ytp1)
MGSSFAAYGIIMLISLRVGGPWLLKRQRSQEWYDSWVITAWGIVNTFTEHRYVKDTPPNTMTNDPSLTFCKVGAPIGIPLIISTHLWVSYG